MTESLDRDGELFGIVNSPQYNMIRLCITTDIDSHAYSPRADGEQPDRRVGKGEDHAELGSDIRGSKT